MRWRWGAIGGVGVSMRKRYHQLAFADYYQGQSFLFNSIINYFNLFRPRQRKLVNWKRVVFFLLPHYQPLPCSAYDLDWG